jgi:isoquinoline 1-oxidoreductase beta subunit
MTTSKHGAPDSARRKFLINVSAAGGGLALGMQLPFGIRGAAAQVPVADTPEINAWVVIKPDDTVIIRMARTEMGQGTWTGLAQLVAEELECDWKRVTAEMITPGQNLARKRVWGNMATGGSRGIRDSHDYVRRGGAVARTMLLQAAANEWGVPVSELTVRDSVIRHPGSNRSTTYGKVAAAAAKLTPPDAKSIKLKDRNDWRIAGKPVKRIDTAPKLNGAKIYGIDLKLPGMLNAAIMQCPVFGGKLTSFDEAKIAKMPGVNRAVRVNDHTVAVVADTWWHAKKALDALPIVWDEGENAKVTSAAIDKHMASGLRSDDAFADTNIGSTLAAIESAARKVEAVYATPFLSHVTMEPMNCTVKFTPERAEAWVPSQNAERSLAALSESTGLPLAQCEVYSLDPGGGFGRRVTIPDYVYITANIAKQFPGVPIKAVWTREEDQMHGFYRPISQCRCAAGIDAQGNLQALYMRVSGQSINAFSNPAGIKDGKDVRQLQGLWKEPGDAQFGYTVPNLQIEYAMRNTHVPVGPWRGVNTNQNGVYIECFMDECAKAAGKDPLEFRRALMKNHPKHLGVLNAAAKAAGWDKPAPRGVFRGIAQHMGYASYSAAVAEVSVSSRGEVKVHRMFVATDCGNYVNPDQIAAQTDGAVAMGLTTLLSEITIDKGRVVETNFHNHPILQLAAMPKVESILAPTWDFWGGVGEPTICVIAPAVMNAIFAATGKPVRSLPLKDLKLV